MTTSELGGTKYDDAKVRLDLVPPAPIADIARVLTDGAARYGSYNWSDGLEVHRLYRAMRGHIDLWWAGVDDDEMSGLPHLAHAGCCLLFIMDLLKTRPECDDRPVGRIAVPDLSLMRDAPTKAELGAVALARRVARQEFEATIEAHVADLRAEHARESEAMAARHAGELDEARKAGYGQGWNAALVGGKRLTYKPAVGLG